MLAGIRPHSGDAAVQCPRQRHHLIVNPNWHVYCVLCIVYASVSRFACVCMCLCGGCPCIGVTGTHSTEFDVSMRSPWLWQRI